MSVHRQALTATLLVAVAVTSGCDAVERARSRIGTTDTIAAPVATGSGLMLGLQSPGTLRPGDEGALRVAVTNHTDTVVSRVHLELFVPGWVDPMPPRPGEPPVTLTALEEGVTRFSYHLGDRPLEPGSSQAVEQRVRVPVTGITDGGSVPWSRAVRARLLSPDGRPLAEVESELGLDTLGGAAPRPTAGPAVQRREQLGPLRLGMSAAEVRQAAPNARDTTWSQEGSQQRGLVVPVGGGSAVAALDGEAVSRIEVADASVRTAERLGVGSRMEELRAAYGSPCADAAAGRVVVWFPNAPGISFALDTPVPQNPAQLRENPGQIPAGARVTRWWVRRGTDSCPR